MTKPVALPTRERRTAPRRPFRKERREGERVRILGQPMDLVRPEEVLHHVQNAVAAGRRTVVANHNLHSLYLLQKHPEIARFYERADLVEVDSTPLIWFSRALGLHSRAFHRCTYLDWRDHFWSVANRLGWRVMALGGAPEVGPAAQAKLSRTYPGADIRTLSGYFDARPDAAENASVLSDIAGFQPHILFVGMGMPRQERWIAENLDRLPDCVILSVGAAFDYEAGVQSAAPRWMGRAGLEWLYRLLQDPKRLFHRYCVEPWSLLPLIWADIRQAQLRRQSARG